MGAFTEQLGARSVPEDGRRWLYVPYDQLTDAIGPLAREDPREVGVVLVENPAKAARRPYHKQKLALVLANQRSFALEQQARGVAVRYVVHDGEYRDALRPLAGELGPLRVMRPAERELREDLRPLFSDGALVELDHEGWLTSADDFLSSCGAEPPWRMDKFYRHVRDKTGILMLGGKPAGGKYSHDADNRQSWSGDPPAPELPTFPTTDVKEEVLALVRERFAKHPGRLDADALPTTAADADAAWAWARAACLPMFGPYEDAMSTASRSLFHSRMSPLLNLHRVLPRTVVEDALSSGLPLQSVEGFVRQVIGWREFVRHVHEQTDGFRALEKNGAPSFLGADRALPPAYWEGAPSGLHCLDTVVNEVWEDGWSHHITRLMVLSNLATLLDVSPRELTDWFWVAYVDAFDWVVEPNVLGMGTFGCGDLMTTKPYVSGAAYLNRMSDYCGSCAFHPKKDCPVTDLYWAFLNRHRDKLDDNPRLRMPMASARKRSDEKKANDREVFDLVSGKLSRGEKLTPADLRRRGRGTKTS